jgi:hypothetical protein
MTRAQPKRIGLEVQFEAKPITGRVYEVEGSGRVDRRFSGWLGLMSAIEAARGAEAPSRKGERR